MEINWRKLEETNFIIFLASTLIVLTSISILLSATPPKQQPLPISREEKQSITQKLLPPVRFTSQDSLWVTPNKSFSLEIIPVGELSALVYRFEILYDPDLFSAREVVIGDFFKDSQILREEIDNQTGKVYFSAGLSPEEKINSGQPKNNNLLATLIFKVNPLAKLEKNLETTISFGEKSLIISKEDQLGNLHQSVEPVTVVITKNENE